MESRVSLLDIKNSFERLYRDSAWLGRWFARLSVEKLASIVNLLMIAGLAYSLAGLTWSMMPTVVLDESFVQRGAATGQRAVMPQSVRYDIDKLHLFGEVQARRASLRTDRAMPKTMLRLTLRGVMAGDQPDSGGAIIAEANGNERFYGVGHAVPGNATLVEVYATRVVLERNGRLETLHLPVDSVVGDKKVQPGKRRSSRLRGLMPEKTLREYRDVLLTNPQSLAGLVRMEMVTENGRLQGYRIRPGRDANLFDRYGLESGDIVTAVNGIALDSPTKGLLVMDTLSGRDRVEVRILRNGVPQTLSFDLNR